MSHCLGRKPPPGWESHTGASSAVGRGRAGRPVAGGAYVLEPGRRTPLTAAPGGAVLRRLECLQRVVSKLQMEAGLCEEQLNHADALLQSVRGAGEGQAGGRREAPGARHTLWPVGGEQPQLLPWGAANSDRSLWAELVSGRRAGHTGGHRTRCQAWEACCPEELAGRAPHSWGPVGLGL